MIISSAPSAIVAHIFSARAAASNVTTGDVRVGWVSAGSGRSTSDILWSCFSILLVCTWKCIHYNIPSIHESEARWHWWGPSTRLLSIWMYKVRWMIGIAIAPEIGVAIAMHQYLRARAGLKMLRVDTPRETGSRHVQLKKTESKNIESKRPELMDVESIYFESKGVASNGTEPRDVESEGVASKGTEPKDVESKEVVSKGAELMDVESKHAQVTLLGVGRDEIDMAHTFFANMGGFIAKICVLSLPEQGKTSVLKISHELILKIDDCQDLEYLLERFPDLRLPAKKDIEDLSKADSFTKAFACVQSTWLVIQSIARVSQGLPITQLELATMAFVVCALIMYMLWWHKPFGVNRRTVLTAITYDWNESSTESLRLSPVYRETHTPNLTTDELFETWFGLTEFTTDTLGEIVNGFAGLVGRLFRRENLTSPPINETRIITFYAAGTLFSAFHIGAWNWEFQSSIIRLLWRTFAVAATGTGPATVLLIFFVIVTQSECSFTFTKVSAYIVSLLLPPLALIYIISRLALIVLIFYCFSSMPVGVYETVDWTKFLPHFS